MFTEAWAGFEENFYDSEFHGEDWTALKEKYAQYLPYLTNRSQLRLLFNDMLGELNTSHFGFNSNGKEKTSFIIPQPMLLAYCFPMIIRLKWLKLLAMVL